MEALISVTVAALAVIDMAKGVDRSALAPGPGPGRLPPGTHTRTPIYATRAAHKGGIKPLCAALCCLIPSLVCDMGWGRPTRAAVPVCPVVRQGDGRKGDAGRLYGGTGGCAAAPFLGHALAGLPFK